jgi:hypothetical protein
MAVRASRESALRYERKRRAKLATMPCTIPGCRGHLYTLKSGLCQTHEKRQRLYGDPLMLPPVPSGADSPQWRGNDVSYHGAHRRVRDARGKASTHICGCGAQARDWAYNNECSEEKQVDGARFCVHPTCYTAMCRACHVIFDREDI